MANVNIKFNGKEFLLSCEDGQEDHLEQLSINLNNKFDDLKNSLGNIGENKLLLIASIKVMDEYFETKKKIDNQKIELKKITERFKELRSLVYDYKDDKEKEPLTYYAMLNVLLAVQVLEKYAQKDDNAIALLESIKKRHEEIIDKLKC